MNRFALVLAPLAFAGNVLLCRLALVAGGLPSGCGYALWYRCLSGLSATSRMASGCPMNIAARGSIPDQRPGSSGIPSA